MTLERVLVIMSCLLLSPFSWQEHPYLDFNKAGAGFYGDGRELPDPVGLKAVLIGVLGPARTPEGLQERTAIQIALEEANQRGGYRSPTPAPPEKETLKAREPGNQGIPFEMVFREDDGPWGVAAKQVVQLAYGEKVWAIIGSLDGLHTHVAELVVSKAWVPVISPSAVDASITYANVPWVFRVAPSDSRQAEAILSIAEKRGYKHLLVASEMERDAQTGWKRLSEAARRRQFPIDLHLEYSSSNPEEIVPRIASNPSDALVVWGKSHPALRLLLALRKAGVRLPVLGCSTLATGEMGASAAQLGDVTVASLCSLDKEGKEFAGFKAKFAQRTGQPPSVIALYSYDVARLVIEAIHAGGLNRARIRDRLAEAKFEGLTGSITFNMLGGNDAAPVLLQLKRSGWVRLE